MTQFRQKAMKCINIEERDGEDNNDKRANDGYDDDVNSDDENESDDNMNVFLERMNLWRRDNIPHLVLQNM